MQNEISAENEYNTTVPNILKHFIKMEKKL